MDEVSNALPDLLWLERMEVKGNLIAIDGKALNPPAVANFLENLKRVQSFQEPKVTIARRRQRRVGEPLQLQAVVRLRGPRPDPVRNRRSAGRRRRAPAPARRPRPPRLPRGTEGVGRGDRTEAARRQALVLRPRDRRRVRRRSLGRGELAVPELHRDAAQARRPEGRVRRAAGEDRARPGRRTAAPAAARRGPADRARPEPAPRDPPDEAEHGGAHQEDRGPHAAGRLLPQELLARRNTSTRTSTPSGRSRSSSTARTTTSRSSSTRWRASRGSSTSSPS